MIVNFSKKMALAALLSTSAFNSFAMNPVDMARQIVNMGTTTAMVAQDVSVPAMILGQTFLCIANIAGSYFVLNQAVSTCIYWNIWNTLILSSAALLGKGCYKAKKPVVETKTICQMPGDIKMFLQKLKQQVLPPKDSKVTVVNNIAPATNQASGLTDQEQQNILQAIENLKQNNQELTNANRQLESDKQNLEQHKETVDQQVRNLTAKLNLYQQKVDINKYKEMCVAMAQKLQIEKELNNCNQQEEFVKTFDLGNIFSNDAASQKRSLDFLIVMNNIAKTPYLSAKQVQAAKNALLYNMAANSFCVQYQNNVNNISAQQLKEIASLLNGNL